MEVLKKVVTTFQFVTKLCNPGLNHLSVTIKKESEIMDINYTFGRLWALLLPIALLVVFFKYLHQLNSILTSIEGVGFRKTLLTLFVAFFALKR